MLVFLERHVPGNKLIGLVAEKEFHRSYSASSSATRLLEGCWLVQPRKDPALYRRAVFIESLSPEPLSSDTVAQRFSGVSDLQLLDTALYHNSFLPVRSFPIHARPQEIRSVEEIRWQDFVTAPDLGRIDRTNWTRFGDRGRASVMTNPWDNNLHSLVDRIPDDWLEEIFLTEAYMTGHLKLDLHAVIHEPYNVDGFLRIGTRFVPLEVKEKDPTPEGYFGIDVGRVMMLLRLGFVWDSNPLYYIREVSIDRSRNRERTYLGWKSIDLASLLFWTNWNPISGGQAMAYGAGTGGTSTLMFHISKMADVDLGKSPLPADYEPDFVKAWKKILDKTPATI